MFNIRCFFLLLENVPADELGKNWYAFQIILLTLGILPWFILIAYLIFFKKFRIRYYVDGKLVYTKYYKQKDIILSYSYQDIDTWYLDEECMTLFNESVMPNKNLKLFAKTTI